MVAFMNYAACKKLINNLKDKGFDPQITTFTQYHDEPRFFYYGTIFKSEANFTDGKLIRDGILGSSSSIKNREEALFKSLCEAMERFCQLSYFKKNINYSLDPKDILLLNNQDKKTNGHKHKIGYTRAINLFSLESVCVPAQSVYLNYKEAKKEPFVNYPRNSNGASGGFDHESTLLRGIYEIAERDAFLGVYLNRIIPPKVNLSNLKSSSIEKVISICKRYNLEVSVFDITNDLGIPCFLASVVDKTNLGPGFSLGAKSSLNQIDAIKGAISEAFMIRLYIKNLIKNEFLSKTSKDNGLVAQRARYWITSGRTDYIKFLTSGSFSKRKYKNFKGNTKQELKEVLKKLKKLKLGVYYSDITIDKFKEIGFFVYKIFIPGLQAFYLDESEKSRVIDIDRIKNIASFFGKEYESINPVPHPFL